MAKTYCEKVGLKVGDKIKYIGYDSTAPESHPYLTNHHCFKIGSVLTLKVDNGGDNPYFECEVGQISNFNLETRIWEKVIEEDVVVKERDKEYNVKLTGEQMAIIWLLLGKTTGNWPSLVGAYKEFKSHFSGHNQGICGKVDTIDLFLCEGYIHNWLDELFATPTTKEQQEKIQLLESITSIEAELKLLRGKLEDLNK